MLNAKLIENGVEIGELLLDELFFYVVIGTAPLHREFPNAPSPRFKTYAIRKYEPGLATYELVQGECPPEHYFLWGKNEKGQPTG